MNARFDRRHTDDLAAFIEASPSPYHAVANVAERLEKAGFSKVDEADAWDGEAGGRYVVRGGAIVAWFVPEGASPETPFRIVGAHTDSPNLRVKPRPDSGAYGWRQVAVEIYGGPLINSWLDRDLGLSGRLALRGGATRLVTVDRALLRVPQLAIHLDRRVNEGLTLDQQRHMQPVWGIGQVDEGGLIRFAAEEAGTEASEVIGWDLMLHDVQPPAYLGRDRELLAAARWTTSSPCTRAPRPSPLPPPHRTCRTCRCWPPSTTRRPAASPTAARPARCSAGCWNDRSSRAEARSSTGPAPSRAPSACPPTPATRSTRTTRNATTPRTCRWRAPARSLKVNVNQRYATDGVGRGIFAEACERADVPLQEFVSSNAMPCGTTIGPITAARHGITTVDVGVPILSMHSARELCGADDPFLLANALRAFQEG